MKRDVVVPLDRLTQTAKELLAEFGHGMGRLVAGLLMPDWPEGSRRAINFSMTPAANYATSTRHADNVLDNFREAQGLAYDSEGE
jgi:hypothetical protein